MKRTVIYFVIFSILCLMTGCKSSEDNTTSTTYQLYFLNEEGTGLATKEYEQQTPKQDLLEVIDDLLQQLKKTDNSKMINPIDTEGEITDFQVKENQLSIFFSAGYNHKNGLDEILSRAAIVKTICQIDGIDYVEFYVEDQPLMLSGSAVGLMNSETFIDELNPADSQKSKQVTLYFATPNGEKLQEITTEVTYSAAEPLAKLLIVKLIEGPEAVDNLNVSDVLPTIPSNTTINSVTIRDNICYVDFSREFEERVKNVKSEVSVYSIVNTLCELPNVSKVQFTIEGEQHEKYGETDNFNMPFERNLNMIEGGAESLG